jgi:hypothetical protein
MIRVPLFPVPGLSKFFTDLVSHIDRQDNNRLSKESANHSLILSSSDGAAWEITVSTAGTLATTKIAS